MPAAAVAIPAIISAGASVGQMVGGRKMAREARKEIDDYQRQDLTNPYEGLQVSTLGADRQRQDLARSIATLANQAAMGGSRAILGLAPQLLAQQNQQTAQIAAELDQQEKQRQQLIARGNEMVQNMTEVREQQDLAGLGQMWQTGRAETMNSVNNLVQTGLSTANAFANMQNGGNSGTTNTGGVGSNIGIQKILHGADVSYAQNPISNGYISNGIVPNFGFNPGGIFASPTTYNPFDIYRPKF